MQEIRSSARKIECNFDPVPAEHQSKISLTMYFVQNGYLSIVIDCEDRHGHTVTLTDCYTCRSSKNEYKIKFDICKKIQPQKQPVDHQKIVENEIGQKRAGESID